MTILQLRLRRQWQALLLCSHLIFPGTSDFLHLEKEYSKRRAHKKMLQLIERIRATARGIGRANNRERGEAGQKDIRLFRTNIVGSAFLSLWVEKQEIEFEGERKTENGTVLVAWEMELELLAFWLDIGLLLRLRAALDPNPRKRQMTRLEIQWSQPYSSTRLSLSATVVTVLLEATSSYYYLQAITSLIADQVNYFPRDPIKASICQGFPIDLRQSLCFLLSDGHARSSYLKRL